MQGIEKLFGMIGLDPEKLTALFAGQLQIVQRHFDDALIAIADRIVAQGIASGVQHREMMAGLHRLDARLDVIEMSLARIDPEFVSADFREHYGLAADDTPTLALSGPVS